MTCVQWDMSRIWTERLQKVMKERGLSGKPLSKQAGLNETYIRDLLAGAEPTIPKMQKIADTLGLPLTYFLADEEARKIKVVGYVGAGAEMHHYAAADDPNEDVPMIPGGNENTVAVEVRGSSLGSIFDRWLVYYDDVRFPPTPDMIGKLCVVALDDDRVLVKRLRRGSQRGLFNLESVTESLIEDVVVLWAAKVKHMTPR